MKFENHFLCGDGEAADDLAEFGMAYTMCKKPESFVPLVKNFSFHLGVASLIIHFII